MNKSSILEKWSHICQFIGWQERRDINDIKNKIILKRPAHPPSFSPALWKQCSFPPVTWFSALTLQRSKRYCAVLRIITSVVPSMNCPVPSYCCTLIKVEWYLQVLWDRNCDSYLILQLFTLETSFNLPSDSKCAFVICIQEIFYSDVFISEIYIICSFLVKRLSVSSLHTLLWV